MRKNPSRGGNPSWNLDLNDTMITRRVRSGRSRRKRKCSLWTGAGERNNTNLDLFVINVLLWVRYLYWNAVKTRVGMGWANIEMEDEIFHILTYLISPRALLLSLVNQ